VLWLLDCFAALAMTVELTQQLLGIALDQKICEGHAAAAVPNFTTHATDHVAVRIRPPAPCDLSP
jgi:hypothetical protein